MAVKLNSSGGGSSTIDSAVTASNLTFTLPTASGTLVSTGAPFSGGTANGVLYLNGSSVPTTSSALTFDGTNLSTLKQALFDIGGNGVANNVGVGVGSSNTGLFWLTGNALGVSTNGSERMRIDSSGNLLVGTTTADTYCRFSAQGAVGSRWGFGPSLSGSDLFRVQTGSGSTGVYLTAGNTSWTANSDERLKTDLKPIEDAANKVSTLRAVTGRYKTDEEGRSRSFLIAQDVQAVLPEAVDASDPEKLGVQYSDVIPLLVAAIKELKAELDATKAEVAALKKG